MSLHNNKPMNRMNSHFLRILFIIIVIGIARKFRYVVLIHLLLNQFHYQLYFLFLIVIIFIHVYQFFNWCVLRLLFYYGLVALNNLNGFLILIWIILAYIFKRLWIILEKELIKLLLFFVQILFFLLFFFFLFFNLYSSQEIL